MGLSHNNCAEAQCSLQGVLIEAHISLVLNYVSCHLPRVVARPARRILEGAQRPGGVRPWGETPRQQRQPRGICERAAQPAIGQVSHRLIF